MNFQCRLTGKVGAMKLPQRVGQSKAYGFAFASCLFEHHVQLSDLLAQLVTFILQLAQLITAYGDIEGLGWSSRHQGTHEHTSRFWLVTVKA